MWLLLCCLSLLGLLSQPADGTSSVSATNCAVMKDAIQVHVCDSGNSEHLSAHRCNTANWAGGATSTPACLGCDTGGAGTFFVDALEVTTGNYKRIFEIPPSRTSPAFTGVNGCDINPVDNILYCMVRSDELYLARIDASSVGD